MLLASIWVIKFERTDTNSEWQKFHDLDYSKNLDNAYEDMETSDYLHDDIFVESNN